MNDLHSIADAARILGISRQLVSRHVKQGRIPHVMVAGRPLIRAADIRKPAPRPNGRRKATATKPPTDPPD